jgi:hypothetical protein
VAEHFKDKATGMELEVVDKVGAQEEEWGVSVCAWGGGGEVLAWEMPREEVRARNTFNFSFSIFPQLLAFPSQLRCSTRIPSGPRPSTSTTRHPSPPPSPAPAAATAAGVVGQQLQEVWVPAGIRD